MLTEDKQCVDQRVRFEAVYILTIRTAITDHIKVSHRVERQRDQQNDRAVSGCSSLVLIPPPISKSVSGSVKLQNRRKLTRGLGAAIRIMPAVALDTRR